MSTDSLPAAYELDVVRWLRPLVPLVMAVVVWAAFNAEPGPDTPFVAVALGVFVVAGVGVLATLRRRASLHVCFIGLLLAASISLTWLQPDGVGFAGIFVVLSLIAPLTRRSRSTPVIVVALVFFATIVSNRSSLTVALLNAIMLASFYGMLFLALRHRELVQELKQSRAAEARAVGIAERQHLAREMHDVLAHSLSGLLLQLEGARMLMAEDPSDPRLPGVVDRAHQLGKSGLDEARRAIGMLRGEKLPGPDRLPALAEQFRRDRGIPCELTVVGGERALAAESRLAIYRVVQEALTNVMKHADADRVEIRLGYGPATVSLVVEDFGLRTEDVAWSGDGYGLTGMRERAELLGGTLTTSATVGGFRVELVVPNDARIAVTTQPGGERSA